MSIKTSLMSLALLASPLFAAPALKQHDEIQRMSPAMCSHYYRICYNSCGEDSICTDNCYAAYEDCVKIPQMELENFQAPVDPSVNFDR